MEHYLEIIYVVIFILSFVIGRYVWPKVPENAAVKARTTFDLIYKYADAFVSWAAHFKKDSSGSEKMDAVVEAIQEIANQHNVDVSESEIRAIAQKAYDEFKIGLNEAEKDKE